MEIEVNTGLDTGPLSEVRVGNVYPVKGGRGLREGKIMILMAVTEAREFHGVSCLMLVCSREGKPTGVTQYGLHYLEEQVPIAFAEGLQELKIVIKSL